jgi:ribosomal-protein-serine acetyltransferase
MDEFNSLKLKGFDVELHSVETRNADELYQIIDSSREHLEEWLPWVEYIHSINDERRMVEQWVYEMQMRFAIHLCINFEHRIVGVISTHQIDWINLRTSIGYWIRKEMTGRNLATEASAVLINYLFEDLKLHRIYIQAATGNVASNKVIKKLGFKFEGILRENEKIKERFLDHNIYGMTADDYRSEIRPKLLSLLTHTYK